MSQPTPPTELGQCVLELLRRYQTEWKASLTIEAMMRDGQTSVTGIGLRAIERENDLAVGPKFQQAEVELLQGTEPLKALRAFLSQQEPREKHPAQPILT